MFGGIWNALTGKSDFYARAPKIDTKAGTAAVQQQAAITSGRIASNANSLLASSRSGGPLAAREAQRRAAMAGQQGIEQATMAQSQLEQNAASENARNAMTAQQLNQDTAKHNAGGLMQVAGGLAGAGAGLLLMSDEKAKKAAAQFREAFRNLNLSKSPEAEDFIATARRRMGEDPEEAIRFSLLRSGLEDFDRETAPRRPSAREEFAAAFRNAGMGERSAVADSFTDTANARLDAPHYQPPPNPALLEEFRTAFRDAGMGQRSQAAAEFNAAANARLADEPQPPALTAGPTNFRRFDDLPAEPVVSPLRRELLASDERTKTPGPFVSPISPNGGYRSALASEGDDGRRVQWITGSGADFAAERAAERDTVARHAGEQGVDVSASDWRRMGYVPTASALSKERAERMASMAAAPRPGAPAEGPMNAQQPEEEKLSFGKKLGRDLLSSGLGQISDAKAKALADENMTLRSALASMSGALQPEPRPVTMRKHAAWTGREMANRVLANDRIPYDVSSTEVSPSGARVTTRTQSMPLTEAEMQRLAARQAAASAAGGGGPAPMAPAPVVPSDKDSKLIIMLGGLKPEHGRGEGKSEHGGGMLMRMMGGGMGMGGMSEHDEHEGDVPRMDFPRGVKPVAFEYKDEYLEQGVGTPGPHVGVLAQDVEKTPEGATVVKRDPETGLKMLDVGGLSALNTAKLSEIEDRLGDLEAAKPKPAAKPKKRAAKSAKGKG